MGMMNNIVDTARSIVKGHSVTLKEMFHHANTIHYPDERPDLARGYRGMPALKVNEEGELNCVACGVCARACPVNVIDVEMVTGEDGKKKREPAFYNLDMSRCMLCNLCVEACPFDALEMTDHFELSDYRVEDLVFDKDELADIWKTHSAIRVASGEKL